MTFLDRITSTFIRSNPNAVSKHDVPQIRIWHLASIVSLVSLVAFAPTRSPAVKGSGFQTCQASPRTLIIGVDKEAIMNVKSGVACSVSLIGRFGTIDGIEIVEMPQQGKITTFGRSRIQYEPNNGFDSFSFRPMNSAWPGLVQAAVRIAVNARQ